MIDPVTIDKLYSPLRLAQLCQQSYALAAPQNLNIIGGVAFIVRGDVIAFRGSACQTDWLRDFDAMPVCIEGLGHVESGFVRGMMLVLEWVKASGPKNPVITGHSLGGAHAALLAALLTANGLPWRSLTTFGCPRPGYAALRNLLASAGKPMAAYRNGADCVPTEPPAFLWWSYRSYAEWIRIGESDDPLTDHYIANYIKSLTQEQ